MAQFGISYFFLFMNQKFIFNGCLYTSAPDKIWMLGRFINKMNIEHLTVDKKDINTIEGGPFKSVGFM